MCERMQLQRPSHGCLRPQRLLHQPIGKESEGSSKWLELMQHKLKIMIAMFFHHCEASLAAIMPVAGHSVEGNTQHKSICQSTKLLTGSQAIQ